MKKIAKLGLVLAISALTTLTSRAADLEVQDNGSSVGNIAPGTEVPLQRQSIGGTVTNGFSVTIQAKDILLSQKMAEGVGAAETVITNGVYGTKTTVSPTNFVGDKTVMWTALIDAGVGNEFDPTDLRFVVEGTDAYPDGGKTNILGNVWTFVSTNAYGAGTIGMRKDGSRVESGTSLMVPVRKFTLSLFNRSFGSGADDQQAMRYFAPFPNWNLTLKVYLGNNLIAQKTLGKALAPMPRILISKNLDGGFLIRLGDTTGWPAGTQFQLQTAMKVEGPYNTTTLNLGANDGAAFSKPTGDGEMFFRLAYNQ